MIIIGQSWTINIFNISDDIIMGESAMGLLNILNPG
jgi:hypothetical protein